jgi:tetratricopeptide (TPR) repeat protein
LIDRYPDEEIAYGSLSSLYNNELSDDTKGLATLERALKAIPRSGPLHNLYGYAMLRSGRYPEALRAFDEYARLNPNEPNPYDSQAETYLFSGQPERALEKYARVLDIDETFLGAHLGRMWAFAVLGRYDEAMGEVTATLAQVTPSGYADFAKFHLAFLQSRIGRYADAARSIAEALEEAERIKDSKVLAALQMLSAVIAIERGNLAAAGPAIARAAHVEPDVASAKDRKSLTLYRTFVDGVARARAADLAGARARLDAMGKDYDVSQSPDKFWYHTLEGEIALASGDAVTADTAFQKGEPEIHMFFNVGNSDSSVLANNLSFRDGVARARKAKGDIAGAIEAYRQIFAVDISQKWTAMLEPRYVLELARLLDKQGDKAGAKKEYQRFLELWKHADPGLPEVAEAKARIGS